MSALKKAAALFSTRTSNRRIGPIGIDFALEAVHLVQLQAGKTGLPEVSARATVPYDRPRNEVLTDPGAFSTLMKQAFAERRFTGRKAVVAVPSGMFRTVSINFQAGSSKESEAAAIIKSMRDRVDGDLADYVLDYMPVSGRDKNDERLALVAVSERAQVVELLDTLRAAKFDVEALEIGPVAISRLVGALSAERGSGNILVINSGRKSSYLTLLSGADLLFDQEVAFGETTLVHEVAETLDMDEAMARDLVSRTGVCTRSTVHGDGASSSADDAGLAETVSQILKPQFLKLVQEIKRVCLYAAAETRGGSVGQVYLLGSVARWPGSDGLLTSMIDVPVEKIPNPLALFDSTLKESSNARAVPEVAVATGLALRGMSEHG